MIVYRVKDKIPVRFKEHPGVVFLISPLTAEQKSQITQLSTKQEGAERVQDLMKVSALAIKYGLKGLSGVATVSGEDYVLEMDGDCMSDSSVDDVLNLPCSGRLTAVIGHVAYGNMEGAKAMKGVELELPSGGSKKN